jgi:hypothetical protein
MRKVILVMLMLMCLLGLAGQTVDNNITVFVTKANQWDVHLQWTNPETVPHVYKVYRSQDPTVLGYKIANVNGTATGGAYDDIGVLQDGFTYYYQILRVNGEEAANLSGLTSVFK